jgi:ferric-dicitrate binding protein FerR (iron transport regulator)
MKWLDEPQGEAERLVREGLDLAKKRLGDELTHRRVWAKVAEAAEMPEPRSNRRWVWTSAAATLVAAAGLFAYIRFYRATDLPVRAPVVATNGTLPQSSSTAGPVPSAPASADEAEVAPLESERAPGNVIHTRAGERVRVALGGGATAELEEKSAITWDSQHRPSIQKGTARLAVPHQPPGWRFSVTAGPYVVTVVGTKFEVHVSNHTVGVDVTEGVVEVWRNSHSTRLAAGESWHGPLYPDEPASGAHASSTSVASTAQERPQPLPAPTKPLSSATARSLQEAETALQTGDAAKAIEILSRTAQGTGPSAENAAYELGRIARYNLNRPRQAVALWDKYRTRFPNGLLRTESDLSIVETLSQMGETQAALAEANAFLARHPSSERRLDVQRLAERLRAAQAAAEAR